MLPAAYGARVIRLEVNSGPAAARNAAARAAGGELLVFFDSDVTLHGDTLRRIADRFSTDPELDALMGSYDFEPAQGGMVAAFRNLLHAWVHHRSAGEASTFWGACGAVRRERFSTSAGSTKAIAAHPSRTWNSGCACTVPGGGSCSIRRFR